MSIGEAPDMSGRVVVLTGGTSGIGLVAAEKLAAAGARMVLVARDRKRGEAALDRLRKAGPAPHTVHYGNLSVISEMKRLAGEIAAAEPRIDVLVNNAGALFNTRQVTADGLEMTFATNHLAYFVMTLCLAHRLKSTPAARVVNTSSDAHSRARLNFGDLQTQRDYRGFTVYGRSKLCNILFTRELAKRWREEGVTVNCLHPGFVATRFGDSSGGWFQRVIRMSKALFAISPEKGAQTIVYLASSPEVNGVTGEYFYKCHAKQPSNEAQNDDSARKLWEESARLTGLS